MAPRYGMNINGRSLSLGGPWPFEQGSYTSGSYLGRADGVRLNALKVAKRLHEQNAEIELAKAAGRAPAIPDPTARQHLVKKDRETIAALRKQLSEIESQVFGMEIKLEPFDTEAPTVMAAIKDSSVNAQLRDRLFNAKDERARGRLLEIPAYRKALYEAPAETSGVQQLTYDRLRKQDIEKRYPEETRTIRDFREAESVIEGTFKALDVALGHELTASGVTSLEKQAAQPARAETEAWA